MPIRRVLNGFFFPRSNESKSWVDPLPKYSLLKIQNTVNIMKSQLKITSFMHTSYFVSTHNSQYLQELSHWQWHNNTYWYQMSQQWNGTMNANIKYCHCCWDGDDHCNQCCCHNFPIIPRVTLPLLPWCLSDGVELHHH